MIVNVSSTNLFHGTGGEGDVVMAWTSRSSINKLATMGLKGEPIAAPSVFSQSLPWKEKYVEICFMVMVVLRCNFFSSSRCSLMMLTAGCIGMDVKSALTS